MTSAFPPDICLVPVAATEIEELIALRIEAMQDSLQRLGRFGPARARFLDGFDAAHHRHILSDGQRVGLVAVQPHSSHLLRAHLYIRPAWQCRDIGAAVLQQLFRAADQAAKPLRDSDANRFYLHHEFLPMAEEEWDIYYQRPVAPAIL